MLLRTVLLSGLVLLLLGLIALERFFRAGGRPYSSEIHILRDEFNKDRGKVRLLMLVSPT